MKYCLLLIIGLTYNLLYAHAQNISNERRQVRTSAERVLRHYEDSLKASYSKIYLPTTDSLAAAMKEKLRENDLLPYYNYKLFAPFTYYKDIVTDQFRIDTGMAYMSGKDFADELYNAAILDIYLNKPGLVLNSARVLDENVPIVDTAPDVIKSQIKMADKMDQKPADPTLVPIDLVVLKPNFWTFAGDYYLQFLQNYVSGNWYKGGESNYSMVGAVTLQANYNNKQKIKWDNKLELKLGFLTSKSDSLHSLKTSEDLIRLTSKLGLQAANKWYYTIQLVAYTQFLRGYKNNNRTVYSDVFSPFNANLSVGMDYNVDWFKHRLKGSVHLAPLAYNFRYVDRLALSTRYGLKEGRHTLHDVGSEFTVDLLWKFSETVSWQTRLYGYTTYSRAELEWENTFTLKFNKYISSKFFVFPRFDDGASRDGQHGYWQFREYFSLGFAYTF